MKKKIEVMSIRRLSLRRFDMAPVTTSQPVPRNSTVRSVGAVLGGFLAIAVLSSAVDAVMHATGVFPPFGEPMSDARFALATAYRVVISIGGCWLAARLSPERPMRHALYLGAFGIFVSAIGAAVAWNAGPSLGPLWYPLLLVAVSMPCAWLGGRLHGERAK